MPPSTDVRPGDPLSHREVEVLRRIANGRANAAAGRDLHLSAMTVKTHLARIYRKLGVHDRAHAVGLALATRQLRPADIAPTAAGPHPAPGPASDSVTGRPTPEPGPTVEQLTILVDLAERRQLTPAEAQRLRTGVRSAVAALWAVATLPAPEH
ncbi:hypothetical protein A6A07_34705 [Streptomyces sp. CB03911]|nr:hypothetical protein A6A07_34705 [Streptomyces sp. CB03911]